MNVRCATRADAEVAASILDEATAYVATLGYDQWPVPFPQDELAQRIDRGELYLVEIDGEPVATVTLLWEDPFFWGERPPDAAYVHKLAVRREYAGRGLGEAVVGWADAQAAGAGRRYLRLDCMRDNAAIRAYYERLGFEYRGEKDDPRFAAALYERAVRPFESRLVPGTRAGRNG